MKNEELKEAKQQDGFFIPTEDNNQDAAFRIFDNKKEIFYSSSRIGGVKKVEGGYLVIIPADFFENYAGKKYTLVMLGTKSKVLEGEIKPFSKDKKINGSK